MTYANATALTVKDVVQAGLNTASMSSPDGTNGNKFSADGRTFLRVKNTGTQKIVTIETAGTVKGMAIADPTFTIPATTGDVLIPILPEYYQPGTQDVFVTVDSVTGVNVDAYRLPVI